jgi:hypothetical protein
MIAPIAGKASKCRASCDTCDATKLMPVAYGSRAQGKQQQMNEGQATNRLIQQGWSLIKGTLRCPDCTAKHKSANEDRPVNKPNSIFAGVTPITPPSLRQPTREQRRAIVSLLEVSYDTDKGCYKGGETDKTVADTIGDGCMPGWVAAIREEFYGDAGANEGVEELAAEMANFAEATKRTIDQLRKQRQEATAAATKKDALFEKELVALHNRVKEIDAFAARLDQIKAAFGPKAGGKA